MKKSICVILILMAIIIATCTSHSEADVFSIRNGIQFGMTRDEVKAIEIENGNKDHLGKDVNLDMLLVSEISLAGYKGTGITYSFNEQGELCEIKYQLYGINSASSNENLEAAITLKKSLKEKYGDPLKKEDGDVYHIFTDSFASDMSVYDLYAYEKFLIPSGDDYVIAELYIYNWGYPKRDQYSTVLAYRAISGKEVNAALEKNRLEQEESEQSLKDDI